MNGHIVRAREVDPFRNRVVRLLGRLEFGCLNEDRDTGEEPVVPAMTEVKVSVDDGGDLADRYIRLREGVRELDAPG